MPTFTISPSYTASEKSQPLIRSVKFGDGYEQRIQMGLSRDPKVWNLRFSNRTDTERDNILNFFEARKGIESFDWTPPRGSASKWVCSTWSTEMTVSGFSSVLATFREVFEP
tara:strand:- start:9126 stop:9461 length:336 start_codon:yes stop_codon:yes gene_type:complete